MCYGQKFHVELSEKSVRLLGEHLLNNKTIYDKTPPTLDLIGTLLITGLKTNHAILSRTSTLGTGIFI